MSEKLVYRWLGVWTNGKCCQKKGKLNGRPHPAVSQEMNWGIDSRRITSFNKPFFFSPMICFLIENLCICSQSFEFIYSERGKSIMEHYNYILKCNQLKCKYNTSKNENENKDFEETNFSCSKYIK